MCDYSLAHFPNRLAVEGEQLIVHRFDSGTLGLAPAQIGLNSFYSAAGPRFVYHREHGCGWGTFPTLYSRALMWAR